MAAKTDGETNACVILWKVENASHCWLKEGEQIKSPPFIAEALQSTTWSLWFLPIGTWCQNNIEIRLHREKDCCGPDEIDVNYKLAFLSKDGSVLTKEEIHQTFSKDLLGFNLGKNRREVLVTDREVFLPDDTLTIQCTIWNKDVAPVKPEEIFARTVLKEKRGSFVWKINKFSTLQPGVRNTFKDNLMEFDFVLRVGPDFQERLVIESISFHKNIKYFLLKISVINSEGNKEYYRSHEYFEDDIKKGISSPLLSTRMLMENKSRYLPNDILSLDCEYMYSTGTISDEFCSHGMIAPNKKHAFAGNRSEYCVAKENCQHTPVLANDLKSLYAEGSFCDTQLRTTTKTFPAHKLILIARSPVFKRMFSNDMRENNSGHIEIDDLEDDTVHRMLLYIYTDTVEDMQLENACKLYVASDKYEILSLRSRCSSFLKDNLCPNKVCEVLLLADQHHDEDMKKAVHDYILKYDKEVFGSQEWVQFMDTNPKLAAEIMYRKICPTKD